MKKLIGLFTALMLLLAVSACDIATTPDDEVDGEETYAYYLGVEINPRIEFIVNAEDKVVSYNLLNEDAEIVAAELDFIGMDAEEALELFLDEAVELGYIDVDAEDNAVFLTVGAEDEEEEENHRDRMRGRAEEYFQGMGIGAAVVEGVFDEELRELAEEYEIGIGRMSLIAKAAEIEGIELEEALDLPMQEVMAILRDDHTDRMAEFREERRENAQEIREEMREMVQERLQQHKERLEDEGIEIPDPDEIREEYREHMEERRESARERVEEHRKNARDRRPDLGNDNEED